MDELDKKLSALDISGSESSSFLNLFKKGSGGRNVFTEHVVPFLDMDDIITGSRVCRQMNAMCRSYTVGDVLVLYTMDHVDRHHKMELGKLVLGSVSAKYISATQRHRRYVRNDPAEPFWARLYHPALVTEIVLAMVIYFNRCGIEFNADIEDYDWDATAGDTNTPVLVAAYFGAGPFGVRSVNVTTILRYLLMKQGNTRLVLRRPHHSPRWWYICLFGDPCERVKKDLCILARSPDGSWKKFRFTEDLETSISLRAEKEGEPVERDAFFDVFRGGGSVDDGFNSSSSDNLIDNRFDLLEEEWYN